MTKYNYSMTWLNLGHVLKIEPIGFIEGLSVEYEAKKGVKNDLKCFGLSYGVNGGTTY